MNVLHGAAHLDGMFEIVSWAVPDKNGNPFVVATTDDEATAELLAMRVAINTGRSAEARPLVVQGEVLA